MTRINPRDGGQESTLRRLSHALRWSLMARQDKAVSFRTLWRGLDSQQIIVNTRGGSIAAIGVSAATGTTQWLGQMSDASLQQMVHGHKESKVKSTSSDAQRLEMKVVIVGYQGTALPKQNLVSDMRKG